MLNGLLKNLSFQSKKNPVEILAEPELKELIDLIKDLCGSGLISCEITNIYSKKSLIKYNSQESVAELNLKISQFIIRALAQTQFPQPEHYLISLQNNFTSIVLFAEDVQCSILVNSTEVNVGIIMNILLPDLKARIASYSQQRKTI